MTAHVADDYKKVAGFNGASGFGEKAAIVVVDFTRAYITPGSNMYCGDPDCGVVSAVRHTAEVLPLCRRKGVPVIFTKVLFDSNCGCRDGGVFVEKIPFLKTWVEGNDMCELAPELPVSAGDHVLVKRYPSAFFGTALAAMLTAQRVDTVILVGCSTSGCIRATACDAMQHGFRVVVPRQCVGDRDKSVHDSNLFDINAKIGDVVEKDAVTAYLTSLSDVSADLGCKKKAAAGSDAPSTESSPKRARQETADVQTTTSIADDYAKVAGFKGKSGFGQRPAILLIDFTKGYVTPGCNVYCGDPVVGVVSAVKHTAELLPLCRKKGLPVIFTTVIFDENCGARDGGIFTEKIPFLKTWVKGNEMCDITPDLPLEKGDHLLVKQYPSALASTPLASMLRAQRVDTIILVGCSTSGCIRATATDAMQNGFRVVVPRQCVGDRGPAVHDPNLFDINAKIGDVVDTKDVADYLSSLPDA